MSNTSNLVPEIAIKTVDEQRLESDIAYRFSFLTDVIDLSVEEHDLLRQHHDVVKPHLSNIVESVYRKMFGYDSMKRHFLPRHTGYEGNVPKGLNDLKLDHKQTEFRKQRLEEYFVKLCTAEWDETFAVLIDLVGHMHTPNHGNAALQIPIVQITALLGVINDLFLESISKLELSATTQLALQRAYTKLFWIQNSMFIRHWTN